MSGAGFQVESEVPPASLLSGDRRKLGAASPDDMLSELPTVDGVRDFPTRAP
jgi:hypothetical protein